MTEKADWENAWEREFPGPARRISSTKNDGAPLHDDVDLRIAYATGFQSGRLADSRVERLTDNEVADLEALRSVETNIGRELPDDMRKAMVVAYRNMLDRIESFIRKAGQR